VVAAPISASAGAAPITAPATVLPTPLPAVTISAEAVQSLVSMGFPEAESRAALTAAMGNPDLAYEFLLTGIPDHARRVAAPAPVPAPAGGGSVGIESLRQHPQFNQLKQLLQSNPAALSQVLDVIGQQNPTLLAAIHANNDVRRNVSCLGLFVCC
jgi:UV excision repair protein RAD23